MKVLPQQKYQTNNKVTDELKHNNINQINQKSASVQEGTDSIDTPIVTENGINNIQSDAEQSKVTPTSVHSSEKGEEESQEKLSYDAKKRKTRKRKPTRKKLRYISSSDEDVPLSVYARLYLPQNDSNDDDTFIPNSKDLNSTDSEFSSDISESTRKHRNTSRQLKKAWNKKEKQIKRRKKQRAKDQTSKGVCTQDSHSDSDLTVKKTKKLSYNEDVARRSVIAANEGRLDQLLHSQGLCRTNVPPHGNCFFEAACHSEFITESHTQLRQSLCKHLEDNALEYMGFLLNKYNPEKEEEFVAEYLSEIENLKKDGYWSNKIADFLPLALANYVNTSVMIFTSKPDQPRIPVVPTLQANETNGTLNLAYISIPNILEHYDACSTIQEPEVDQFTARPLHQVIREETSSDADAVHDVNKTPRKGAQFVSPAKKKLYRKRKATPENWKKNIRKRLRLGGEEYISVSGKTMQKKQVQPCDCSKCKYKCTEKISSEQRQVIRDLYYGLDSYERQKDYICTNILEQNTRTFLDNEGKRVEKRKQVKRNYSFEGEKGKVRVCKKFFLKTLCISEATVIQALSKKVCGHFQGKDERGRHIAPNKTNDEKMQEIRKHIESFPTVESHYVRKSSNRQYLATDLNIKRMYEAYVTSCKDNLSAPVTESVYRRVFNEEYNISFHKPKKDQCSFCTRYENAKADGTLDENFKDEYSMHQQRKTVAREHKHKDSNISKQNSKVHTCTFDLQSVLYTPCSLVSVMYYMRKLCCYNLSIYSAGDKNATCFLWSETQGKRGSNEISTCLHLYLSSLDPTVEHVIFYSDACTGQNKNQIVATCLLHSVTTIPHIKTIDHKFLESGHTHMECDSMHAAIEFAKSKTQIFVPSQWDTVITMARRKNPYHVVTLKHHDFKDFKGFKANASKATKDNTGQKPKWTSMKWMRFVKDEPDTCQFKYELDHSEVFQKVKLLSSKQSEKPVQQLYKAKLPISSAKKKDLVTLCKQGVIPAEFHEYYKGLPANNNVKERLPEPDKDESDNDTDVC